MPAAATSDHVTLRQNRPTSERIGLPPYPTGWYRIAASADVAPGDLISMRWFGQGLVCWRKASGGDAVVFDSHCAHMGADIGVGGFVKGENLVCPFHHWAYGCDGRNVEIPYRDKPQRSARQRTWEVCERAGQIFVWYDEAGEPSTWQVPVIEEESDPALIRVELDKSWSISTHVQEVLENTVDVAHFQFVHGVSGFGSVELVERGPMFRSTASVTMQTGRGPVDGAVESELWGLGIDLVRMVGVGTARSVFTTTPVDEETIVAHHTFFVPKAREGDGPSRYGIGFMEEFGRQIEQDIPIWETKLYRDKPRLATGENAILDFRRWSSQFYPASIEE